MGEVGTLAGDEVRCVFRVETLRILGQVEVGEIGADAFVQELLQSLQIES